VISATGAGIYGTQPPKARKYFAVSVVFSRPVGDIVIKIASVSSDAERLPQLHLREATLPDLQEMFARLHMLSRILGLLTID